MPLHPQSQAVLEAEARQGLPPLASLTGAEARARGRVRPVAPLPPGLDVQVQDWTARGPAGDIPVRVYRPSERDGLAMLMWFHGGGWVTGDLDSNDAVCALVANQSGAIVISVDYRLAPEHPYPAAAEDAYAATRWAAEHASELRGNAELLAVGGASAGGNLAAAVTLMAKDREGPHLVHQLLVYPVTDRDFTRESYETNGEAYGLTRESMQWYWEQYMGPLGDATEPYAAPLHAESLDGLPRAHVITAEFDPLRDEGEEYARCLEEQGVMTVMTRYPGMIHGFFANTAAFDDAQKAIREAALQLRISLALARA